MLYLDGMYWVLGSGVKELISCFSSFRRWFCLLRKKFAVGRISVLGIKGVFVFSKILSFFMCMKQT